LKLILVIAATHSQCGERRDGVAGKPSAIQVNAFHFQPRVQPRRVILDRTVRSWSLIGKTDCVDIQLAFWQQQSRPVSQFRTHS